jgi:hypothetical protein
MDMFVPDTACLVSLSQRTTQPTASADQQGPGQWFEFISGELRMYSALL